MARPWTISTKALVISATCSAKPPPDVTGPTLIAQHQYDVSFRKHGDNRFKNQNMPKQLPKVTVDPAIVNIVV